MRNFQIVEHVWGFQFSNIIRNLETPISRDIGILLLFPKEFQFAMKYVEIIKIALNP